MNSNETNLDKLFASLKNVLPDKKSPPSSALQTGDSTPYIIVGLGNPGKEYQNTRHNVGFMVVDSLADHLNIKFSRVKFNAAITNGIYSGSKVILVKPQTYMNLSGQAVGSLLSFYKAPIENLIVAYDDIDIPFGQVRIRPKGGAGGQKGVASIIQRFGTEEFARVRVGIGRPPGRKSASKYVLQDFDEDELIILAKVIDRAKSAILAFIEQGLDYSMNQFNVSGENN